MEAIDLKDFVHRTLVDVAQGVRAANTELKQGQGGVFCLQYTGGDHSRTRKGIEFDVAVMASKGGKETSGFMVALVNLGGGARTERATENELLHRIRFEVGMDTNWG